MTALGQTPTPEDLRQRLLARRAGLPFLVYRALDGAQQLLTLCHELGHVTLGRGDGCDVDLGLDPEVSRVHAELQRIGHSWVIVDGGLSRNGTFVNGERVGTRRKLTDGDVIRCGATFLTYHEPLGRGHESTRPGKQLGEVRLTEAQRRILIALCRPLVHGGPYALPASNKDIAAELFLSVQAVKGHLRTLFAILQVEELPHNQKRLRLVERAVRHGLISVTELR